MYWWSISIRNETDAANDLRGCPVILYLLDWQHMCGCRFNLQSMSLLADNKMAGRLHKKRIYRLSSRVLLLQSFHIMKCIHIMNEHNKEAKILVLEDKSGIMHFIVKDHLYVLSFRTLNVILMLVWCFKFNKLASTL